MRGQRGCFLGSWGGRDGFPACGTARWLYWLARKAHWLCLAPMDSITASPAHRDSVTAALANWEGATASLSCEECISLWRGCDGFLGSQGRRNGFPGSWCWRNGFPGCGGDAMVSLAHGDTTTAQWLMVRAQWLSVSRGQCDDFPCLSGRRDGFPGSPEQRDGFPGTCRTRHVLVSVYLHNEHNIRTRAMLRS